MRTLAEYAAASDASLVLLARGKDQRAFAVLVERHQQWLRNLLRRLSHDRALADDLAQQVLFRAWEALDDLRGGQALAAWLKTIAVRTWLSHLRRKDPLFRLDRDAPLPEEEAAGTPGLALDLDRALAQLPEAVRLCVVLAYFDGMSHGDITNMTGLPLGTVKSHIARGSAQLRGYLAAYSNGGPPHD